jgi:DNA-binding CsgD family transcriptional regulator
MHEQADGRLAQLVMIARHDDLAARIVLQRLLPGLVHRARRWTHRMESNQRAIDEIVTAAWSVIRTFPESRLHVELAARLQFDSEYRAFKRDRRRLAEFVPTEPQHLDRPIDDILGRPIAPLDELLRLARESSLDDRELAVLQALLSGDPMPDVAEHLQVSIRTVSNWRTALVERLRAAA